MASIVAFAYPASYPNMSILHSYGCCWLSVPTGEGSVTHTTQQRCTQRSFGNISPMRLIQQMRFLHYMWTRRMDTKVLIKFRFNRSSYLDDGLGNSESEHFLKIFIIEVMLSWETTTWCCNWIMDSIWKSWRWLWMESIYQKILLVFKIRLTFMYLLSFSIHAFWIHYEQIISYE